MSWEVHVTGPQAVLGELERAFREGELSFSRDGEQLLLRGGAFDSLVDAREVRSEAERVIQALSGISRLLLQSESPLKVSHVAEVKADGRRDIFLQVEPAVLRISGGLTSIIVTRADGTVEEHRPSDPAPKWLAKALSDPQAAQALRLRDTGDLSWTDLYRLYEVIEAGSGGENAIVARGWATRSELRRFKHSANSVAVAGDEARHGVEPTQPPSNAMTLAEARSYVDRLLRVWLENGAV